MARAPDPISQSHATICPCSQGEKLLVNLVRAVGLLPGSLHKAKVSCHACSFPKSSKEMANLLKLHKQSQEKTRQMEAVANSAPAATAVTEVQPIRTVDCPSLAEAAEMASDLMGQETEPETLHRVLVSVEVCWCLALLPGLKLWPVQSAGLEDVSACPLPSPAARPYMAPAWQHSHAPP